MVGAVDGCAERAWSRHAAAVRLRGHWFGGVHIAADFRRDGGSPRFAGQGPARSRVCNRDHDRRGFDRDSGRVWSVGGAGIDSNLFPVRVAADEHFIDYHLRAAGGFAEGVRADSWHVYVGLDGRLLDCERAKRGSIHVVRLYRGDHVAGRRSIYFFSAAPGNAEGGRAIDPASTPRLGRTGAVEKSRSSGGLHDRGIAGDSARGVLSVFTAGTCASSVCNTRARGCRSGR